VVVAVLGGRTTAVVVGGSSGASCCRGAVPPVPASPGGALGRVGTVCPPESSVPGVAVVDPDPGVARDGSSPGRVGVAARAALVLVVANPSEPVGSRWPEIGSKRPMWSSRWFPTTPPAHATALPDATSAAPATSAYRNDLRTAMTPKS
jgi:hypothetical protein